MGTAQPGALRPARLRREDGMSDDYAAFVARKTDPYGNAGFDPLWVPDFLYDFQRHLVEWAIRKGRGGPARSRGRTQAVVLPAGRQERGARGRREAG